MKRLALFLFILILALLVPTSSLAKVITSDEEVTIASDEVINDDLYIAGSTVEIAGTVNGDLYAVGGTVSISGQIKGDALVAGGIIRITGKVSDDVRMAGGYLSIDEAVIGDSVTAFGGSVSVDKDSKIGGGVTIGAGMVSIDADVTRGIVGGAGTLSIGGKVGKEIKVGVETLTVKKGAKIAGDISYTSENEIKIDQGATVSGKVSQTLPQEAGDLQGIRGITERFGWGLKILSYLAVLLIGSLLIYFLPAQSERISMQIREKPGQSLLWGILAVVLILPVFVLLMISIVGIPLGFILLGIFVLALYLTQIFVGLFLGRLVFGSLREGETNAYLSLALGLAVYHILTLIPVGGAIISLATVLFGLGAIFTFTREYLAAFRS